MKKWKRYVMLLVFALVFGLMFGCSGENASKEPAQKEEPKAEQAAFPVTVKDGLGEEVTIKSEPQKIVSLIPSNTEIAYALGLGDKIVGVSDFDNYPEDVKKKEKIGGMEFNVEKIISLKPDLVLAHASGAHNSKDGLQQLKDAGITVLVVNDAKSFADVYGSIGLIGKATGTAEKAQEIVDNMKTKLAEIKDKAKQIKESDQAKVWVEVSPPPQIYTAGKGTFMDEMLQAISAKNVAGDLEGWPMVTEEKAVAYKPDVIITTYGGAKQVLDRPAWKDVPAVQNKRVYDVNIDLVSRPGPRLIEGVEELAKAIYPDIFK
ncbi:ABC transporter substrate-binding protein [Parageobacillus thermoglucosidasius]|uniref:Iron ABC transporter substrate-binding protein n=1 Tax=Parageobacillus thermoglucosidasius TaxID=1426 RepID=A0AAN0YS12_PARTM|nr:ABC transporter substrate-binding protein [Parageobacillus thermoglucosidasius]ALF11372.1 iron ABC transporter substrate-binding protein [Parageobacillus thermoglucosidasius]ANZ31450.1 iron ABC transporter substrate-binding protein [Parageobacillus thermoglucosidasius]APM82187.1 iron ABC transporter substrate-binding protein [Parageobacillus thermoglucosidasius]KJX69083.1 iron ABC transporter substrate-binding protein [Parageobacillus thermoglucosidasius]RDE25925.1 ABC transporter substrate